VRERVIRVDELMNRPVIQIEDDKKASEAEALMKRTGTRKVVVTHGGEPKGVLEIWKITPLNSEKPISEIPLSGAAVVMSGTDLNSVRQNLIQSPAVVVVNPQNPKEILGVVTATDLIKKQALF